MYVKNEFNYGIFYLFIRLIIVNSLEKDKNDRNNEM
ncbi:hypothetical protein QFZ37_001867 [Chryseobacterium ginsenosidimutans]|nr:hypothetical protein [Chryseobacterium ginsenosidimutans]